MKGLLRIYDENAIFKCSLYYAVVNDNFLKLYEDKKSKISTTAIDLCGSKVNEVFNERYNINMMEVTADDGQSILFAPDNVKDFHKWKALLEDSSKKTRNLNKQPDSDKSRREFDHIVDHRKRNIHPEYEDQKLMAQGPTTIIRKPSNNFVNQKKRNSNQYGRRESKLSSTLGYRRDIGTVKEDPMMSDDEILVTTPLKSLRKNYPITDKTKRWSIAATDLVGKSNDEIYLMLIQLNRERSHMEVWKESLQKLISGIEEELKTNISKETARQLEMSRRNYVEKLNEIEHMMNISYPLITFMDGVIQMSDAYAGNNEKFHAVYHECTPTGKEDYSNIYFIRLNQEKQIAKLIIQKRPLKKASSSSLYRDTGSDKENSTEALLNINNSEEFLHRRNELEKIVSEIGSQLKELNPSKVQLDSFITQIDAELDSSSLANGNTDTQWGQIRSLKNLKDESKSNNSAFLPKRSTRKVQTSDMGPFLIRKKTLKHSGSGAGRSHSASFFDQQNFKKGTNDSFPNKVTSVNQNDDDNIYIASDIIPTLPISHRSKSQNLYSNNADRPSSSKVKNQFRDLITTDYPRKRRSPSPIYRAPSSFVGLSDQPSAPLLKINPRLYQNVHRPKSLEKEIQPLKRLSNSDSEVSTLSQGINQRLNLDQSINNNKHWKNPGSEIPLNKSRLS